MLLERFEEKKFRWLSLWFGNVDFLEALVGVEVASNLSDCSVDVLVTARLGFWLKNVGADLLFFFCSAEGLGICFLFGVVDLNGTFDLGLGDFDLAIVLVVLLARLATSVLPANWHKLY